MLTRLLSWLGIHPGYSREEIREGLAQVEAARREMVSDMHGVWAARQRIEAIWARAEERLAQERARRATKARPIPPGVLEMRARGKAS